ncbi:MAG: S8 family serine peptidase [Candidatus Omnitrophica bacterium]|nr:S8 family serine peptidase [Candidatus Omnitrophota bacterium]
MKSFRQLLALLVFLAGISGNYSFANEGLKRMAAAREPDYVPHEIILKLKYKESVQSLFAMSYSTREIMDAARLADIRSKYNLKDEKPVFPAVHQALKDQNGALPQEGQTQDLMPIYLLKTDGNILEICQKLKTDPSIEYAEPNYIVTVETTPNDPFLSSRGSWQQEYDDLWGIKKVQSQQTWAVSQGQDVVVAVIDSGVDYNHSDLWDNIWVNPAVPDRNQDGKKDLNDCDSNANHIIEPGEITDNMIGWNFANNNNDPMDGFGHGTHCAGTIAAVGNNAQGVIGVAPRARIMPLKGLKNDGSGSIQDLANCVLYAAEHGAKVLSNSWGATGTSWLLMDAFHYAYAAGCVCIAAAGNANIDCINYTPASIDTVLAVAASDQNDGKCYFSNFGNKVAVCAPGGGTPDNTYNILSTMSDQSVWAVTYPGYKVAPGYWRMAGTSMACPHVAGVAALILAAHQNMTNDEVGQALRSSADDVGPAGWDRYAGHGRVNAFRAVTLADQPVIIASISSIDTSMFTQGVIKINGKAKAAQGCTYKVEYRVPSGGQWKPIAASSPVNDTFLADWNILGLPEDGVYLIRVVATDTAGQSAMDFREFNLSRVGIDSPINKFSFKKGEKAQFSGFALGRFKIEYAKPGEPRCSQGIELTGGGTAAVSGVLGTWDTGVLGNDPGEYEIYLTLADIPNVFTKGSYFVETRFHEGWPLRLLSQTFEDENNLLVGDLGLQNSGLELVVKTAVLMGNSIWMDREELQVYSHNGILSHTLYFPGNAARAYMGTFSLYNPNNQPGVISKFFPAGQPPQVHFTDIHGNEFPGYPVELSLGDRFQESPMIVTDFDGKAGKECVIINSENPAVAYIQNAETCISKQPQRMVFPFNLTNGDYGQFAAAEDNAGLSSLIVAHQKYDPPVIYLDVYDQAGNLRWGKQYDNAGSCTVITGDSNHDGKNEIVYSVSRPLNDTLVYATDLAGNQLPGWPVRIGEGESVRDMAMGDLDGDARPETVVVTDHAVTSIRTDGSMRAIVGTPLDTTCTNVLIADINNEEIMEIMVFENVLTPDVKSQTAAYLYSQIEVYTPEGKCLARFYPRGGRCHGASAAIKDIDGDGKLELVVTNEGFYKYDFNIYNPMFTTNSYINVFDLEGNASASAIAWGQFRHDPQRTGCYTAPAERKFSGFLPESTALGKEIVLQGRNLDTVKYVTLDPDSWYHAASYEITITSRTPDQLVCILPKERIFGGYITLHFADTSMVSKQVFLAAPTVDTLTPPAGIARTQLVMRGPNIGYNYNVGMIRNNPLGITAVRFGVNADGSAGVPVKPDLQPDRLVVQVPYGLTPGNNRIAIDYDGGKRTTVVPAAFTFLGPPLPPSGLSAQFVPSSSSFSQTTPDQVSLSWQDNSDNEKVFKVQRRMQEPFKDINGDGTWNPGEPFMDLNGDGVWTKTDYASLGCLDANKTSYMDTKIIPYAVYFYRVNAINYLGQSAYSNEASVTIPYFNGPPVITHIGDKTIGVNKELKFVVNAADPDEKDTLTYKTNQLPSGAQFDASSHVFTWTPAPRQEGKYMVTFSVSDGHSVAYENVVISVTPRYARFGYSYKILPLPKVSPRTPVDCILNLFCNFSLFGKLLNPGEAQVIQPVSDKTIAGSNKASVTIANFNTPPVVNHIRDKTMAGSNKASVTIANFNTPPVANHISDKTIKVNKELKFVVNVTDPYDKDTLPAPK